MWEFRKAKQSLQVSLAPRKKAITPLPEHGPDAPQKKRLFRNWKKTLSVLMLLAAFAALSLFFADTLESLAKRLMTKTAPTTKEGTTLTPLEAIVREVGEQYLLPSGETPTLAMITSLEELEGQPFFVKAQVGDAVLMYLESKKAILWRPSTRQVIEVGPILVVEPSSAATPSATST